MLLLSSLLVVTGCASADTESSTADTAPADTSAADTTSQAAEPSAAVPELLQFTAPAVGGGEIDAAVFAGKPTVFWFWAPT